MAQPVSLQSPRARRVEILEGPVLHDPISQTAVQCIAQDHIGPLDRKPSDSYTPNYHLKETPPTQEACSYFQQGKTLSEKKDYEGAIEVLLKALQINPAYEEAEVYLDFCIQRAPKISPQPLSSSPLLEKNRSSLKTTYIDQLLRFLDSPLLQNNVPLKDSLRILLEELMRQDGDELTSQQEESHKWFQKLVIDNKVSDVVADKLQQITSPTTMPQSSSASSKSATSTTIQTTRTSVPLPLIAFGKAAWAQYFGDVGVEPPLPSNIEEILNSPCPIWPGKTVHETHILVLVPQTVNNQSLTLKFLGELVRKPLQGKAIKYRSVELGDYKDPAAPASHWTLITRDLLPTSRDKPYEEQQKIVQSYPDYQVPKILDATTAMFVEYFRSGMRLYPDKPATYTRCQEKFNKNYQLIVGGFSAAGISLDGGQHNRDSRGVGASIEFKHLDAR
jgi:tetratricopeptide (TPR) repeat protein